MQDCDDTLEKSSFVCFLRNRLVRKRHGLFSAQSPPRVYKLSRSLPQSSDFSSSLQPSAASLNRLTCTMPSFKTLSMIATFAFAAFTAASPVAAPAPIAAPVAELALRGGEPEYKPVPQILIELDAVIKPLAAELEVAIDLKKGIDIDVQLKVVVDKIKIALQVSIDLFKVVKNGGYKDDDYLTYGGKKYDKVEIAIILSGILKVLFYAIFVVLKLVGALKVFIILPLLKEIAVLVAELLTLVFFLVVGLLAELLPLISVVDSKYGVSVISIIVYLAVPGLIVVLGGLLGVLPILIL
ncbi:hypothetical protein HGRIS_014984 [Hohenbuehelia grisea]|uniref:Transmembrane protein n=1 Tax=Hohenbuehelia grisea TaxID=104357 RepID=A0ABR3JUY6_9AGAR